MKNTKKFFTTKKIVATIMVAVVAISTGLTIYFCTSANAEEGKITPTQAVTAASEATTEKATVKPTDKATEAPTAAPTVKPTVAPTQKPTVAPTAKPTVAPTVKPTVAPTQAPTAAPTSAPTQAPTAEPTVAPTEEPTEIEHSTLYNELKDIIKDSSANGYKVLTVDGSDNKMLVLSCGKAENDRAYKFYEIDGNDVTYIGKVSGSHTTAYTEKGKTDLCLFKAHQGVYFYGSVTVSEQGKLSVSYGEEHVVPQGQDYPKLPGDKVNFLNTTDFSGIADFDTLD